MDRDATPVPTLLADARAAAGPTRFSALHDQMKAHRLDDALGPAFGEIELLLPPAIASCLSLDPPPAPPAAAVSRVEHILVAVSPAGEDAPLLPGTLFVSLLGWAAAAPVPVRLFLVPAGGDVAEDWGEIPPMPELADPAAATAAAAAAAAAGPAADEEAGLSPATWVASEFDGVAVAVAASIFASADASTSDALTETPTLATLSGLQSQFAGLVEAAGLVSIPQTEPEEVLAIAEATVGHVKAAAAPIELYIQAPLATPVASWWTAFAAAGLHFVPFDPDTGSPPMFVLPASAIEAQPEPEDEEAAQDDDNDDDDVFRVFVFGDADTNWDPTDPHATVSMAQLRFYTPYVYDPIAATAAMYAAASLVAARVSGCVLAHDGNPACVADLAALLAGSLATFEAIHLSPGSPTAYLLL